MRRLTLLTFIGLSVLKADAQWTETTPPKEHYPAVSVKSIDSKLYAATNSGLYVSENNGQAWTTLHEDGGFKQLFKTTGGKLVATYHGTSTVLNTTDNGQTWNYDTAGIYMMGENKATFYSETHNRFFLSLGYPSYGLFHKTPDETSWTRVNSNNIGTNSHTNISHITGNSSKLYAAGYKSFFTSSDGGLTWTQVTTTGYPGYTDAGHSDPPFILAGSALFLSGEGGMFKSTDEGVTWTKTGTGITNLFFGSAFASTMFYDGEKIYAGTRGHNDSNFVYSSADMGDSWQVYKDILPSWPISITKHKGAIVITRFNNSAVLHDGNFGSTALNETEKQQSFEVYPVPANNNITIRFAPAKPGTKTISVFAINGQKVATIGTKEAVYDMDLSGLQAGIYYLQVLDGNSVQTRKITIQK